MNMNPDDMFDHLKEKMNEIQSLIDYKFNALMETAPKSIKFSPSIKSIMRHIYSIAYTEALLDMAFTTQELAEIRKKFHFLQTKDIPDVPDNPHSQN